MNRTDRNLLWVIVALVLVVLFTPVITLGIAGDAYGGGMGMVPSGMMGPGMMTPDQMPNGMMPGYNGSAPGATTPSGMMPGYNGSTPGATMPYGMMGRAAGGWAAGLVTGLSAVSTIAFWGAIMAGAGFFARRVTGGPTA